MDCWEIQCTQKLNSALVRDIQYGSKSKKKHIFVMIGWSISTNYESNLKDI